MIKACRADKRRKRRGERWGDASSPHARRTLSTVSIERKMLRDASGCEASDAKKRLLYGNVARARVRDARRRGREEEDP